MGFFDKLANNLSRKGSDESISSTPPTVVIKVLSATKRELDFSNLLTPEMKVRKRSGKLEWMDLVDVFEGIYMPSCEKEGRKLIRGNYLSSSTNDRFKITWEAGDQIIKGEYKFDDRWWIVTETLSKKST